MRMHCIDTTPVATDVICSMAFVSVCVCWAPQQAVYNVPRNIVLDGARDSPTKTCAFDGRHSGFSLP